MQIEQTVAGLTGQGLAQGLLLGQKTAGGCLAQPALQAGADRPIDMHHRMIVKVLAYPGKIGDHIDAEAAQVIRRSDA